MALREELERDGNWLFRWRSQLPLVILALSLVALPRHPDAIDRAGLDRWWGILCLGISFTGLGLRALTLGFTASRTSGRNTREQRADSLNTTGMYSIVRHPLYLGNAVIGLGVILISRSWWMTLIYVLAFWLYYERIMLAEEGYLRNKFGAEFTEWAEQTPAFLPRLGNWRRPGFPFCARTVLRREYGAILGIISCLFFLEVIGHLVNGVKPVVDVLWIVLLIAGALFWVVFRILGKLTNVLSVSDR